MKPILRLLYNMKLNMNIINQLEFLGEALNTASLVDLTMPVRIHAGARDFYQRTGLYTYLNNPACIMINGRCQPTLLSEHHLTPDQP